MDAHTFAASEPAPGAFRLVGNHRGKLPRCSMTTMEVQGRIYRIEFWTDRDWECLPPEDRPPASPAHAGGGWFLISPA